MRKTPLMLIINEAYRHIPNDERGKEKVEKLVANVSKSGEKECQYYKKSNH
jgi:hypothetical protein